RHCYRTQARIGLHQPWALAQVTRRNFKEMTTDEIGKEASPGLKLGADLRFPVLPRRNDRCSAGFCRALG
ncbi:TPA: hypothetical protein ACIE75_005491, partial [Klebsiella pneumoniae]